MRHELERGLARKGPQPQPVAPEEERLGERERLAGAVGNTAMQRAAASPDRAPAGLLTGAPMSVARFSGVSMAERPTGALREEEELAPEGAHETPPAEASAPAEAPAAEPETLEPVEESEPGSYNPEEESYL